MKTTLVLLFIGLSCASFAQSGKTIKTDIKVYGNCGMCKMRIQKALDRTGIKTCDWNAETKNLSVVYSPSKVSERKIHQLIAEAGHDTDLVKAKDEVYAKLPFCCLYRDHDHSGMEDYGHGDPH